MTISWDLYRSFLAVARQGSLSGAARALGATQPTIGRHVDLLEKALGAPLFTRSQSGLLPTALAVSLIPRAESMESAAASFERAVSAASSEDAGTVRVTASEIVGAEVLPAMLTEIHARRPGLAFELTLTNQPEDLLRRDADIAVRMFRPTQDALIARRIGEVAIGLFAHRRYVERRGIPQSVEELGSHTGVGYDRDDRAFRSVAPLGAPLTRELFGFRSDSDVAQLAAVRAGFGIGGCQIPIARRDPELIPVLADKLVFKLEVWLAMHEDLRASRTVKLTFDALAAALARYVAEA